VVGVLACVIAVVALAAVALTDQAKCDGDGGVPYSAADSPAGRFCDGSLRTPWAVAALALPLVVLVVMGVVAGVRRRWLWVWLAPVVSLGTLLCLTTPVLALGQSCSASDQRAYDRWVDGGREGPPPADCEKY
jgi:hypothetical protein